MTHEQLQNYKSTNSNEVIMPDGKTRTVRMTPDLWKDVDFLQVMEGITTQEIAEFALEEMELQKETFERAFRGVVAHLANRWTN